jgi:cbb3-type cytochrome oxidase maturation protein
MTILIYLVPLALGLGALALGAFLWALRSGQFDDLDGAANRILYDDEPWQPEPESAPTPSPDPGAGGEVTRNAR